MKSTPLSLLKKIQKETIIGIDLGTTNSCVSIVENGVSILIPDTDGRKIIPSTITIDKNNLTVGDFKSSTFREVKRIIGQPYNTKIIENEKRFLPYELLESKGKIRAKLFESKISYSPEELSSYVLTKMKSMAENYLKKKISKAVITVPAYFNDNQRSATIDAGKIAGLEVVRIINEPSAAAIAYSIDKTSSHKKILVYDIGGGTLDVAILTVSNGMIITEGTAGNTHLGGSDFDAELMKYCLTIFNNPEDNSLHTLNKVLENNDEKEKITKASLENIEKDMLHELKKKCEKAKIELSTKTCTTITISKFFEGKDLYVTLTRSMMNTIFSQLLMMCLKPIDEVLELCNTSTQNIDEILLVGGMSRMPLIRNKIAMLFGKQPNVSIDPDEVVGLGAGITAQRIADPKTVINGSEDITIIDTVPLSLGVNIKGLFEPIIKRGMYIPISSTEIFSCDKEDADEVLIQIYEGERPLVKDNFYIGEFILPFGEKDPNSKYERRVEVEFSIDVNGMVNVAARSFGCKNESQVSIALTTKGRLNENDVQKIIKKAEKMKLIDRNEISRKFLKERLDNIQIIFNANKIVDESLENMKKKIDTIDLSFLKNEIFNLYVKYPKILKDKTEITSHYDEYDYKDEEVTGIRDTVDKVDVYEGIRRNNILLKSLDYLKKYPEEKIFIDTQEEWMTKTHTDEEWESKLEEVEKYLNKKQERDSKSFEENFSKLDELCKGTILFCQQEKIEIPLSVKEIIYDTFIWINEVKKRLKEKGSNINSFSNECKYRLELILAKVKMFE